MSQIGKVTSFSLSAKNKKDLEKQKKLAEEEAAAQAYEQFVATFDAPKPTGKVFVRGNVINPNSGKEIDGQHSGKFYKPEKLEEIERQKQEAKRNDDKKPAITKALSVNEKPPKKKGDVKKKSNLETFKEELKMIQEEREERYRLRIQGKDKGPFKASLALEDDFDSRKAGGGSHDTGDPNTTNIYLGNLNPKLSENQLCEIFGRYGPLASVKIMWPRTDEERTRNRNCGFVAFMCRKDGERAMKAINGKMVLDFEMRLGWGKSVPIPANPIYIPPALRELTIPPPPSGLPFNAQIVDEKDKEFLQQYGDPRRLFREDRETFDQLLSRAIVKVVTPTERPLLAMIHRVVEFVVREGPMFEALLMSREANNPMFSFLFDNQSPGHVYYRWRIFSILQGDHQSRWRTKEFRMFENGSIWKPPPVSLYLQGMPEELLPKDDNFMDDVLNPNLDRSDSENESRGPRSDQKKGQLSEEDREDMEELLRSLTPQRSKIAELMVFCIDHADAWEEITECISDSLIIAETPPYKKIGRLFLVNDILANVGSVKVANVSNYRKGFQSKLMAIFESFNQAYCAIEGRLKADHFKQRVMNCFRAWEDTAIYSSDFLIKLQNIFLGLSNEKSSSSNEQTQPKPTEDIDGIPIDPDLDGEEMITDESASAVHSFTTKFKPSKWETIDPDVVESQAITSKWENLDKSAAIFVDDDIDGKPMEESNLSFEPRSSSSGSTTASLEKTIRVAEDALPASNQSPNLSRDVLREIELKVIRYQDDLETDRRSGRRKMSDSDIAQMVEKFREELLRKATSQDLGREHKLSGSSGVQSRRSRSRSRSPKSRHSSSSSSSYHYKRYASPPRRSRSRSPKRRK